MAVVLLLPLQTQRSEVWRYESLVLSVRKARKNQAVTAIVSATIKLSFYEMLWHCRAGKLNERNQRN